MRLLCASNLHLGRSTFGVPDRLGIDNARLSMTATWDALGDLARAESVDAVLVAGDLIDRENRRFEPAGPIERGLTMLARHDIPVIVVAGDEDVDALRVLADADTTSALRLLGRDGTWETTTITGSGGSTCTVAGWSAPGRTVTRSPLVDLEGSEADIVMLHGTPGSDGFAPIDTDALPQAPGRLWITGAPSSAFVETHNGTTLLVPGNASARSPMDVGPHGAWVIDIDARTVDVRQVPLGAIRFDHVDLDLTGCESVDDVESRIIGGLQRALDTAVETDSGSHLVAACAHLTLFGRTPVFNQVPELVDELQRTTDLQREGVVLAVVGITNLTEPTIDLDNLLERADPVGETARIIHALNTASMNDMPAPYQDLIRRTAMRLAGVHRSRVFATVSHDPEPSIEDARTLLRREAWATLDALVRQRGIDQEGGRA